MKNLLIFTFTPAIILLLSACGEEGAESSPKGIEKSVDTYLDSRVHVIDMAKQSAKENNKQVEAQNKALEALTK